MVHVPAPVGRLMHVDPLAAARAHRAKRTLLGIALVVAAPVVLSYAIYHFAPAGKRMNYGELLPTVPAPAVRGSRSDGAPFRLDEERGSWRMIVAASGACDERCTQALYATRQARTMQGRERERIQRVLLVADGVPPDPRVLAEHPDVVIVHVAASQLAALPRGIHAIYLVDPLGNQVLAWPADPDIKALARDLARVLKASRIG